MCKKKKTTWGNVLRLKVLFPSGVCPAWKTLHYQVSRNASTGIILNAPLLFPCVTDWQGWQRKLKTKKSLTGAAFNTEKDRDCFINYSHFCHRTADVQISLFLILNQQLKINSKRTGSQLSEARTGLYCPNVMYLWRDESSRGSYWKVFHNGWLYCLTHGEQIVSQ